VYNVYELSKVRSLAESNPTLQRNICNYEKISKDGDIFSSRPDEEMFGIHCVKHSRMRPKKLRMRDNPFFVYSKMICSWTWDTTYYFQRIM